MDEAKSHEAMGKRLDLKRAISFSCSLYFNKSPEKLAKQECRNTLKNFPMATRISVVVLDKFWLEGQLRISAVNQVEFLESLYFK